MEHSKIKIQKHVKGFKEAYKEELDSLEGFSTSDKRKWMEVWKRGFYSYHPGDIDWYEGMPSFLDPEYRIHPLMGHQVRSRRIFTPEGLTQAERLAEKVHHPKAHPKVTPYDLDPEYRDKGEKEHAEGDLKGVKQYPLTLKDEPVYPEPTFAHIKSVRLRRSVELLELKIGYDHASNAHVLYSPLKYNERWDTQSQAIWLRVIGMSPKRIGIRLKIKYDTIKNWMRALKGQPLVGATEYDWAIRQVEGSAELMSKRSSIEAKGRTPEAIP